MPRIFYPGTENIRKAHKLGLAADCRAAHSTASDIWWVEIPDELLSSRSLRAKAAKAVDDSTECPEIRALLSEILDELAAK